MPATPTQLRELGEFLADIHGQHAHQALLRPDAQRALLDEHAGLGALAKEVGKLWRDFVAARREREEAQQQQAGLTREREMLGFQVEELERLNFGVGEWGPLNLEHARLTHAASLLEGVGIALEAVSESELPLTEQTERLAAKLFELAEFDVSLRDIAELLSEAAIRLDEAGHALKRYQDRVDLDPQRLAELDQRIADIMLVTRKYRVQPDDLPALLAESRERLDKLTAMGDPVLLAERERKAQEAFQKLATQLSAKRAAAAKKLSAAVTDAMQELAMAGGRFDIALQAEAEGNAHGLEKIEFQVAANPSQPLRPLAKVASGGELSRIGLSIQVIASASQSVPTLIFDEVDVGIGGSVAEIVGRRLRELGTNRQVLCVTHLPQVAAQANWQWKVVKQNKDGQTLSRLVDLDQAGRVEEIARMLGGVNITETTRSHAAELLGV
jgi:DNA repair protein RecN (Recombination protein N)